MRTVAYCGDHTALTTTKWGAKIYVDTRDTSLAPHIMLEGDWEPWVTNAIATVLQQNKGCVFVDVGANVGWYTLLAAHLGAARIFAIEPNPRLAMLLRRTVAVNGLRGRAFVRETAAGAAAGKAHLMIDPWEAGGAHLYESSPMPAGSYSQLTEPLVAVSRLDDEVLPPNPPLAAAPVTYVVKIDVEGYEPQVLLGAERLLALRPVLFIEHHQSITHQGMLTVLRDDGYTLHHVQHSGHPGPPLTIEEVMAIDDAETVLCTPKGA